MTTPTDTVRIREVGLRDGLQAIARTVPTATKLTWLRELCDAGVREVEVGSFVPARLLLQLADTAELVAFAKTLPGLVVSVLVPNVKGRPTGLDFERLMVLRGHIAGWLEGEPLHGNIWRAGLPKTLLHAA